MASFSIITVTMNHLPLLKEFLASVDRALTGRNDYELIVVDNCSTDGTVRYIQRHHPNVKVYVNNRVKGFAANNNFAIQRSKGDYILLLNPDIQVLPDSIDNLIRFMEEHPDVGLVGPKLLNPDFTVQYSSRRFIDGYTLLLRLLNWGSDNPQQTRLVEYLMKKMDRSHSQPVDWLIGAAMIVRRKAILDVGLMDENFFLYIEDQDWCYRMWKAGWKVYYLPEAQMIHVHQRLSVKRLVWKMTYYHAKSLFYFLLKHRIVKIPPPGPQLFDPRRRKKKHPIPELRLPEAEALALGPGIPEVNRKAV